MHCAGESSMQTPNKCHQKPEALLEHITPVARLILTRRASESQLVTSTGYASQWSCCTALEGHCGCCWYFGDKNIPGMLEQRRMLQSTGSHLVHFPRCSSKRMRNLCCQGKGKKRNLGKQISIFSFSWDLLIEMTEDSCCWWTVSEHMQI